MKTRSIAAAAALALVLLGSGGARGSTGTTCSWPARLDPTAANALYPDEFAAYWITSLPAVDGETLTIHGQYPHSRYLSFVSYTGAFQSIDGVNDERIDPDPGSTNPFVAGHSRTEAQRDYTVRVIFGRRPANAPNNVLYTTNEDGTKSARGFFLAYRVFRADDGRDDRGGVALPTITVNLPGGASTTLPQCDTPGIPPNDLNPAVAGASVPWPPLFGYPGTNPASWHKFYNFQTSVAQSTDNERTGTAIGEGAQPLTTQFPQGGFADNPDNNYVFAFLNAGYGPVAVAHGHMPTTPRTFDGEPVMGSGQLRYWSICSYHALSERVYGCLADDELTLDDAGDFTVSVSSAANRPPCAVDWLPAGPFSDTLLIVRNMMPASSFANSIQAARLNHEAQDMGASYPQTTYPASACAASASHASHAASHTDGEDAMECGRMHARRSG